MKEKIIGRLDFPIEAKEDMGGDIFYIENTYPLEYSLLLRGEKNCYVIYEVQRSELHELYRSENSLVAEVFAAMLIDKKLGVKNYDFIKSIDDYIEKNDISTIIDYFSTQSFSKYFSVGKNEYGKISLLIENEKATIFFHDKEFVFCKNRPVKIALSILASFSIRLEKVTELYMRLAEEEKEVVDFDDYVEKYIR